MTAFEKNNLTGLEIAVIGMAGRFPGAKDLNEFWENLKNGVESISFFSDEELSDVGVDAELLNSPNYIKARGIAPDSEYFDSLFFGYIHVEAELMDPQTRIFHECAWEALEAGGYAPDTYKGRIGLYAGASTHLRWEVLSFISEKAAVLGDFAAWQLYDKDFMSTRVSYNLNLSGPSISVHTACSTSLVAIHLACQGLLSGECHLALAGGVTASGKTGYLYQPGIIFAPDGHCRAFAAGANGTVPGEGVGIVLLKTLEKALAHRDYILAVIKSSAINNDGKDKVGYTAPSVKEQAAVIRNAHRLARTKPETITYIETHGTGTNLGDPVEMEALIQAFNTDKKGFCRIGSVKSNLGHTDVAAGVAGFIKTVLALKYKTIPPTLHVEKSNPKIEFQNSPFVVNTSLVQWKSEGFPLRAGVSSFGAGGTNAHVVLEQAPVIGHSSLVIGEKRKEREYQLILLSAKTETALERMAANLAGYMQKNPGINIGDIAYTLQAGRQAFEYRRTLLCRDSQKAAAALAHPQKAALAKTGNIPVIFMFPGQGSQYVNMGLDLYRTEPVFREEMDRCFEILNSLLDYDIKEILYPTHPTPSGHPSQEGSRGGSPCPPSEPGQGDYKGSPHRGINQTEVAQPLIFIIEYALSRLLLSWGLKPYAMVGHSIGEYVAACTAGVFSLEEALEIVVLRGRLMQKMLPGAMVSVSLSEADMLPLLTPGVSLAAVNTPAFCVVSGSYEAIDHFSTKIKERGHETRPLHTSHAFHSEMMEPILNEFEAKISQVALHKPRVPYISNLTGDWIRVEDAASPRYWAAHLREPVQFSNGLAELLKKSDAVFLEVGPGKALSTFARQHPGKKDTHVVIELLRHPGQNEPDDRFLADKIGRLWLCGVKIDWNGFYPGEKRRRVPLPTYPFEGQYYKGPGTSLKIPLNMLPGGPGPLEKKKEIAQWIYLPSWEQSDLPLPKAVETIGEANWLVFIDTQGVGTAVVKKLAQSGQHVMVVKAGDGFNRINDREFTVNPRRQDHYERLFAALPGSKRIPRQILHLWGVTGNKPGKVWLKEIDDILDPGFFSLLNIVRAIGNRGIKEDIQIGIVTDSMQEVSGIEDLCPGKAVVLGAVKAIPLEYKNIRCCSMDIVLPEPGSRWEEKITDHLLAEFAEGFPESIAAYRRNHRWLPVIKPVPFDAPGDPGRHLKEKGVYLITGGLGGIGLTLADYLAKSVHARLILVGRSPFPARDEWESRLSGRVKYHRTSIKIRKLMEIEKAGGEVLAVNGDVSNLERMQEIVALSRERFGEINGVIHAAGVPDGALIQRRTREMTEQVLASKVKGTLVLDHIFKDEPLDFFVLCSSLASILVPPGQVGYGAANAFLDAFALYKASGHNSPFTVSINWDTWQETGMAVEAIRKLAGGVDIPDLPPVKADHPLFDYSLEKNPNEKIYVSHFSVKTHWVLDEHRLLGKPTLPGTGCVELARAAFADHTGNEFIEFHGIHFLTPLRLGEDEEKEVHTVLTKEGDRFKFVIKSKVNPAGDKWEEHAAGEIGPAKPGEGKKHDIKKIMARCSKEEILVTQELWETKEKTDNLNIVFGPRWNNLRRVNFGENEVLLLLELPGEFSSDIDSYKLHPALLDTAIGYFSTEDVDRESSLPFSLKGLKVNAPLTHRMYSYLRYDGKRGEGEKLLTYSVTLMDENGVELVGIEEYSRLTVSGGAMDRLSQTAPVSEERLLEHGLLNSEGIEVFRRIMGRKLPRVIVSTKDFAGLARSYKTSNEALKNAAVLEELGAEKPHGGALRPRPVISKPYTAPANEIEKKIVETWQNFLGIEPVGTHDDFFELGGDSLKVITVVAKIHKRFDVEIPLNDFFNTPTPAGISGYIKNAKKVKYSHIEPVEKKEYYPLSSAQERMHFLQQLDLTSVAYNMTLIVPLGKNIDKNKLEWTAKSLIARHEGFRTSFIVVNEITVQRIHNHVEFETRYYDASQVEGKAEDIIRNFVRPFDLSKAPLIRSELIKLPQGDYTWVVDMHHIISDGTSLAIISGDFKAFYLEEFLPGLRVQYKDFSQWQNREKENLREQEKYWKKEFEGEIPVLDLPTDYPRPAVQSHEGSSVDFEISPETTAALKALAVETGATLFMVMLGIYTIFLSKITHQEDILVGTPVAGRSHADLGKIIGIFVNTLVMRNYPAGEKTFTDFIREIKENTLKAIKNQDYQYEDIVEQVAVNRDFGRNPLFDTMLVLRNADGQSSQFRDLIGTPYEYENETSKFDLTLIGVETGEKLLLKFEYCIKLFKRETAERFITYFNNIVRGILEDKEQRISHLQIITGEEKRRILFDFNDTDAEYPGNKTIHELFADQVKRTPENIAVVGETHELHEREPSGGTGGLAPLPVLMSITYKELNEKTHQLAGLLIEKGVKPDTIVGIMVERSIEMIIGIMGILMAGGAYLPIDPEYPAARINYMLSDSSANVLVTTCTLAKEVKKFRSLEVKKNFEVIFIDSYEFPGISPSHLLTFSSSSSLTYVIYTSGSTGRPKGVMVEHRNVLRLVKNSNYIHFSPRDRLLPTGSAAFDITTFEIWGPLLNGAALTLMSKDVILNAEKLKEILVNHDISILHLIPQLFNQMAAQDIELFAGLRYFLVGGDLVHPRYINKLRQGCCNINILHMYGPTENTTFSTFFLVDRDYQYNIPIGSPISNSTVYILDKYSLLQPVGIMGELCVGGEGIARGYMNNPELTAEKIKRVVISHSSLVIGSSSKFSPNDQCPMTNDRLYRTGDLARWLPDGNIEFLGRIDHQVKIRGFRIELGEIEGRLLSHADIKEAVVVAKERAGNDQRYLAGYIAGMREVDVSELRRYLSLELPGYMIPSYFVQVETFPLTPNGKIDVKALPAPEDISLRDNVNYIPPKTPVEKKLTEVWGKVLSRNNISVNENFFMVGGDSIKSIRIISRMNSAGYKLEMKDLFRYPVISELAPRVKKLKRIPDQSVITGTIPLTPIQEMFFHRSHIDPHHYNQAVLFYSRDGFDKEVIKSVFTGIQEHHDALRMTYEIKPGDGNVIQIAHGLDYPLSLEEYDLKNRKTGFQELQTKVNGIQSGIHLEKGPLMKLGLFHLDDGDRLLIAVHHLVIDGVSWRILLEDIETLYRQYKRGQELALPSKTDSFKLWSEKLSVYANSKSFLKEKTYWQKIESVEAPPITKNFEVEENNVKDTRSISFTLGEEETELLLTKVNEAFRTEINDILLTALVMSVKKTFGQDRLLIALEGHGREEILEDMDISRTVGWFTSVYPVMMDISSADNTGRQLKEIKETLRRIPNKGIGYGILKYLTGEENKKEIEFKDVNQISSFEIAKESAGNTQSLKNRGEYLLDVSGMTTGNRLTMNVSYNETHFKPETIAALVSSFESELKNLIAFCCSRDKIELTPGDFTYKGLSIESIDRLTELYPGLEDLYTLTPMQEGMLFHAVYDSSSYSYFEQMSYRIQGDLDIHLVEKSLNELFKRHDILRTAFVYKDIEHPVQVVLKDRLIDFYFEDISKIENREDKENYIKEFKRKDKDRSFDLSQGVLMRVSILRVDKSEYEFTWSLHHILMDGWCIGILNADFFEIYNSYVENRAYRLPAVKPYRTYIQWLEQQDKEASSRYWQSYLELFEEQTGVPKTRIMNNGENGYRNETVSVVLNRKKTTILNKLSARYHVTLNTMAQTVWGILLGKYNRKNDVVFGAVVSGRPFELEGVESMVGLFINTIPVRIRFEEKMKFHELLQNVQEEAIASEPHHYHPLAEIQSGSTLKQNLIDHLFIFENYPIAEQIEGYGSERHKSNELALELTNVDVFEQTNYDFNIIPAGSDQLRITFKYNGNVYNEDFVERIANHFILAFDQVIENKELQIEEITLLSGEEKNRLLYEFNNTAAEYPADQTIQRLFEEQVKRTPDNIAVVGVPHELYELLERASFEGTGGAPLPVPMSFTYRELNKMSAQLAHLLIKRGVQPDTIVGIKLERSIEMIISMLGILKTGSAYLPIDPGYPEERINYMLSDSQAKILLTTKNIAKTINFDKEMIYLDSSSPQASLNLPEGRLFNAHHSKSLAYVIYTSGSTGRPKGVLVEHHNAVNVVCWFGRSYLSQSNTHVLMMSDYTFDPSVNQVFGSLLHGAVLYIVNKELLLNLERLRQYIEMHQVHVVNFVPAAFNELLGEGKKLNSIRVVLSGGERLDEVVKNNIIQKGYMLYNQYGPTETTIDALVEKCSKEKVTLGTPISNVNCYVFDKYNHLVPMGVVGELCVGGAGVARGYLNNPELTFKKFINYKGGGTPGLMRITNYNAQNYKPNSLHASMQFRSPLPHSPIYRTGDLARWLPDGNIEFLGRVDLQVKIRGFRIEPGEIEERLMGVDSVKEAVVIDRTDEKGDKYLIAYIVSEEKLNTTKFKDILSRSLPEFMIPSYFIQLEKIPLNPNGKVNRKALPIPQAGEVKDYTTPANIIEEKLVDIWSEVLGIKNEKISTEANFFDLGGHSLKATIMVAVMQREFGINISLKEIFKNPTIKGIAALIKVIHWIDKGDQAQDNTPNIKEVIL
jgi:amino acid adenylation domain-containing protein/non-ribosomal peptide synthase protein (TIGR01720 family)